MTVGPDSAGGVRAGGRWRRLLIAIAACLVVAIGPAAIITEQNTDVLARGELFSYTSSDVYRVEVFDRFTLYTAERFNPTTDVANAIILFVAAGMMLMSAMTFRTQPGADERRLERFFLLASAGLAVLAADELLEVSETILHNLRFLGDLPGIEDPTDLEIVAYGVPATAYAVYFRDILASPRMAFWLFVAAVGTFVLAAGLDVTGQGAGPEEKIELVSSVILAAAFVTLALDRLAAAVAARPGGSSR